MFWIRVLESIDRQTIRRYWNEHLLQEEIDKVISDFRIEGIPFSFFDIIQEALGCGKINYVVPWEKIDSIPTAIAYIKKNHKEGDPCMCIQLRNIGLTVCGGWSKPMRTSRRSIIVLP
jgi:hypothetical protein